MHRFQGTGVAVVTPFTVDKKLDKEGLRQVIQHLIAGGVEYIVALGTTGEPATLSLPEQEEVLAIFEEETSGKIPWVVGIGGNDTAGIIQKVKTWTTKYKVDGILSVSPYYNKPTQEGIFQHFSAMADATDLPIILYNVPGRTASNMTAETTLRLAHEKENIVAMKEASGNMGQIMEIIYHAPEDFIVVSGDDALALPMIGAGAQGLISVIGNAYPSLTQQLVENAVAGKMAESRVIQQKLWRMMQLIFEEGNPAGVKAILKERLGIADQVRLPLVSVSDDLAGKIKTEISQIFA
ncbi:MAG: 4-hydroxy-tetrahydrodipicolinate synthase, partial [Bacteroidota bacterium]